VLHPATDDHFPQADDNAIVLAGTIEGTRVLLVSDLGSLGQKALLERSPDLRADIVITGLPTRPEAVNNAFLEVVRPRLIIVVDSEYPVAERASPKLMARLASKSITVLYTRLTGSTTIEWHKDEWELRTTGGGSIRSGAFIRIN
jgi:competence protein ComEC